MQAVNGNAPMSVQMANQHRLRAGALIDEARELATQVFEGAQTAVDPIKGDAGSKFAEAVRELIQIPPGQRDANDMCGIYYSIGRIAGRAREAMPCCLLCLEKKKLIASHVIPESILKRLTHEVEPSGKLGQLTGHIVCTEAPNHNRAASSVSWKLFCKPGCEDLFSDHGESRFAEPFWKFITDVKAAREGKIQQPVLLQGELGDNSVHYCVASIVFRYGIMNGLNDTRPFVDHAGEAAEHAYWTLFFKLRNYLLEPATAEAPHIELFASEEEVGGRTMITQFSTAFDFERQHCYSLGHFELSGFHFIVSSTDQVTQVRADGFSTGDDGFRCVIPRVGETERLTVLVKPQQQLTLPKFAVFARLLDAKVWRSMVSQRSPERLPGDQAAMPNHPLAKTAPGGFVAKQCVRLPDHIKLLRHPADGVPYLRFKDPDKHEILFQATYRSGRLISDIWLCRHTKSKQLPYTAVISLDMEQGGRVCFGFHLAEALFEKDPDGPLELSPLRGTNHEFIEEATESDATKSLIRQALKEWWKEKE